MAQEFQFHDIGFIGTGNMGSILARAAAESLAPKSTRFHLSNRTRDKAEHLAQQMERRGAKVLVCDNKEAARDCDLIFLGVKPQMMEGLFGEIGPVLRGRETPFTLVTMAAGISCDRIRKLAGMDCPVIRIMPNTPAAIGAGTIQVCTSDVSTEALADFKLLLKPAGRLYPVPENLMDASSAVSGCGPAFAYLFIEALADGGVACGLPRELALDFAAQTVAGAARMVLETGRHPGTLKDAVCSPGGTTIQGVRALEERGFRSAAMEAVIAAYEKTKGL